MKKLKIGLLGLALTLGVFGAIANAHDVMPATVAADPQFDVQDASGGPILFTGTAAQVLAWEHTNYPLCTANNIQCTKVYDANTSNEEPTLEVLKAS